MARETLMNYTPVFWEEAVKTVLAQGLSVEETSLRMCW